MSRVLRVLSAVVLTMSGTLVAASPASAATTLAACVPPNHVTSTYSPPLTDTVKSTSIEVVMDLGLCLAPNTEVTSGGMTQSITGVQYSCASLIGSRQLTLDITWDTGQTSTLVGEFVGGVAGPVLTNQGNGTVTQGLFEGAAFSYTRKAIVPDVVPCLVGLGEVSSSSGPVELLIVSL